MKSVVDKEEFPSEAHVIGSGNWHSRSIRATRRPKVQLGHFVSGGRICESLVLPFVGLV